MGNGQPIVFVERCTELDDRRRPLLPRDQCEAEPGARGRRAAAGLHQPPKDVLCALRVDLEVHGADALARPRILAIHGMGAQIRPERARQVARLAQAVAFAQALLEGGLALHGTGAGGGLALRLDLAHLLEQRRGLLALLAAKEAGAACESERDREHRGQRTRPGQRPGAGYYSPHGTPPPRDGRADATSSPERPP